MRSIAIPASSSWSVVQRDEWAVRTKPSCALPNPDTSPTLIERVIATALTALGVGNDAAARRDTLVVVATTGQAGTYAWLGGRVVEDSPRYAGLGPLAGLHAGLRAAQREWNMLLACDLPSLNTRLLQAMFAYPREYAALVPRLRGGLTEPLHAIYNRTACLPAIEANLQAGIYPMRAMFAQVNTAYIDEPDLRRYDPDLTSFSNINTPVDMQRVGRAAERGAG